jgi:hypothetical protein
VKRETADTLSEMERLNDWLLHTNAGIATAVTVQVAVAAALVSLLS